MKMISLLQIIKQSNFKYIDNQETCLLHLTATDKEHLSHLTDFSKYYLGAAMVLDLYELTFAFAVFNGEYYGALGFNKSYDSLYNFLKAVHLLKQYKNKVYND